MFYNKEDNLMEIKITISLDHFFNIKIKHVKCSVELATHWNNDGTHPRVSLVGEAENFIIKEGSILEIN